MYRLLIKALCGICILGACLVTQIAAQPNGSAEQLVREVSAELIEALQQHQGQWGERQAALESEVKRIVMPHVALNSMAKKVVGSYYWAQAGQAAQQQFQVAFAISVIRTYSGIFANYSGEKVRVMLSRFLGSTDDRAEVLMIISKAGRQDVVVKYRLQRQDSKWLINNFVVEDVDMLNNYQDMYGNTLQRSGLVGLTADIAKKNRETQP